MVGMGRRNLYRGTIVARNLSGIFPSSCPGIMTETRGEKRYY